MSYLLEALRKSERERQEKTAVPGLQTPAVEWEGREDGRSRSPWLIVAVVAICLNTILLAVLVWRFGFAESDTTSSANVTGATSETAATGTNPVTTSSAQTAMPAVIVVQQPREPTPAIVVRERTPETLQSQSSRVAPTGTESNRYSAANDRRAPATARDVATSHARDRSTGDAGSDATHASTDVLPAASDTPPPNVNALPVDIRQQLPLLAMNSHIYASNARDSFIMINGISLNPGDEISSGLRLVAVVPEGAVLDFRGQRFLLPALSSFSP